MKYTLVETEKIVVFLTELLVKIVSIDCGKS
jgi:hypothetical protein